MHEDVSSLITRRIIETGIPMGHLCPNPLVSHTLRVRGGGDEFPIPPPIVRSTSLDERRRASPTPPAVPVCCRGVARAVPRAAVSGAYGCPQPAGNGHLAGGGGLRIGQAFLAENRPAALI